MGGTDRRVPGGIRDVLMSVVTLHRRMYPPERCRAVVLCALPTRRKSQVVPLTPFPRHFSRSRADLWFLYGARSNESRKCEKRRAHSQSGCSACENAIKSQKPHPAARRGLRLRESHLPYDVRVARHRGALRRARPRHAVRVLPLQPRRGSRDARSRVRIVAQEQRGGRRETLASPRRDPVPRQDPGGAHRVRRVHQAALLPGRGPAQRRPRAHQERRQPPR